MAVFVQFTGREVSFEQAKTYKRAPIGRSRNSATSPNVSESIAGSHHCYVSLEFRSTSNSHIAKRFPGSDELQRQTG